jgi:hypothetical protein
MENKIKNDKQIKWLNNQSNDSESDSLSSNLSSPSSPSSPSFSMSTTETSAIKELKNKDDIKYFDFKLIVLCAAFFSYMLASLLSNCYGVFFEFMQRDLNFTNYQVNIEELKVQFIYQSLI